MKPSKVIAEIGCVHLGNMDRAKNLIKLACLAGANYAKFQKRNPVESVPKYLWSEPHPNQIFAYGSTYLEHRMNLELTLDQHLELKDYCETIGIGYSTSVWDLTSAKQIAGLQPDFIKIGSPTNNRFDIIDFLFDNFNGQIHISLGMINRSEKDHLIDYLLKRNDLSRLVLYHCTSEYPCPFEHLYLLEIGKLRDRVPNEVSVGFSNHGYGIAADIAAYILGAEWIERHFVDDRTLRHTDAAASLEPQGLGRLCRDLKAVHKSLTEKTDLTEEELKQRKKLRSEA